MFNLIQLATNNESKEARQQAEQTLMEMREQNPDKFFQEIIEIFTNKENPINVRVLAGTVTAVSIVAKVNNNLFRTNQDTSSGAKWILTSKTPLRM